MKFRSINLLTKCVILGRTGVYKKVQSNKAKCVFGEPHEVGSEIPVELDVEVFVVYGQRDKREPVSNDQSVTIVIQDECDQVLKEVGGVSMAEAAVIANTDAIMVKLPKKRKPTAFVISETGYEPDIQTLFVEVMTGRAVGREGDDSDDCKGTTEET